MKIIFEIQTLLFRFPEPNYCLKLAYLILLQSSSIILNEHKVTSARVITNIRTAASFSQGILFKITEDSNNGKMYS